MPRANKRLSPPSKEEILALPLFPGLRRESIHVPITPDEQLRALTYLLAQPCLGFDTEALPSFVKGEPLRGPDVVQFATAECAYVLPLVIPGLAELVAQVLVAPVVKVGFGLSNDVAQLTHRFGTAGVARLDLDTVFNREGYGRTLGVKGAIAVLFGQRFLKSKRVSTSNWAKDVLSDSQLQYAGNDAYAAYCVYTELLRRNVPGLAEPLA